MFFLEGVGGGLEAGGGGWCGWAWDRAVGPKRGGGGVGG